MPEMPASGEATAESAEPDGLPPGPQPAYIVAVDGTARGVRLLSPEGCERALAEQYREPDGILGVPMRYGNGYGLPSG